MHFAHAISCHFTLNEAVR